jgi:hypothetical protein
VPNSGSVVCTDYEAWIPEFGNPDYNPNWSWPIDWEWISVTAIPLEPIYGGEIQLTVTSVSQDPDGGRAINFTVVNPGEVPVLIFLTLTQPNFSVT